MPSRERRSVLRSLFLPGSKKYWNLKTEHARVLFIVLLTCADDFGRLEGAPEDVKSLIPRSKWSEKEIETYIKDLKRVGLVLHYKVENCWFIEVVDYWENQDKHGISQGPSKWPSPTDKVFVKHHNGVQDSGLGVPETPLKRNNVYIHDTHIHSSLRKEGSGEETINWSNFAQAWKSHGGGTAQRTNKNKTLYTEVCQKYGEGSVLNLLGIWAAEQDDGFMRKNVATWKFLAEGVHDIAEAKEAGHGTGKSHKHNKAEERDAHNAEILEGVLGKPE